MKKKIVLSLLTLASICATAGVASLTNNVAKADGTVEPVQTATATDFYLEGGAAVRFKDENATGLRFEANVDETYIKSFGEATIQYCMLLAPKSKVSALADLTVETAKDLGAKAIYSTLTPDFTNEESANETFTYYGAVTYDMTDWTDEEIEQAYTTSLVARPYIVVTKTTGKEVVYADITKAEERSMRGVVENAIEDLIEKNENAPEWTQTEFDSVLPYTVNRDAKAFHEQGGTVKIAHTSPYTLTETALNVNTDTLKFVDGASYAGQAVYVQGTETVSENTYVTLEKYGDIAVASVEKNAVATRIDASVDLPATALSATSSILLYGTSGIVSTNFTQVTQVIDTFQKLKDAFDYGSLTTTWISQGRKTGHYVLASDINNTTGWFNYTNVSGAGIYSSAYATNLTKAEEYKDVGFDGIFDGLGHSITIKTGGGLFNALLEGVVIRNVAFKDIQVYTQDKAVHNPIGDATTTSYLYPSDNGKKGSISNVYISFDKSAYDYKHSALPTRSGWLDMENIVVDLDYTGATTVSEGSSATGIYLFDYAMHNFSTTTNTTGTPAILDNVHVFVTNCNAATAKYTYQTYNNRSWSVNANLDPEKFPYGEAGRNIYTKIGEYTSYADFANGVTSRNAAGNVVEITATQSLAKFTESEYWKVVTVGEGDTAYSYPTWYR
ncbi:MAG: hypothetical protein IJ506_02020 [Clostridia bacterium]|nr:hypothetical protein [Clostridia bacterium]